MQEPTAAYVREDDETPMIEVAPHQTVALPFVQTNMPWVLAAGDGS